MQRVRDIAPQPPSANQLARLDRQLQDKLLQQHVLQPASPASALVSAERHDAAVRNLRIRNAAELAGMQTEARSQAKTIDIPIKNTRVDSMHLTFFSTVIVRPRQIDALVEEQQRLCRLEESLLGHSGPSEAASSTESSRSTDSHIVTAREHARRLQLLTGLIQQRLVDRAEIDQLAAAIVAARSAAARARKLESYRETANRPAAQQREISIQRSVEALERERAEIARLEVCET